MRRTCVVLLVAAFAAVGTPSARAAAPVPKRVFIRFHEGLRADFVGAGVDNRFFRDGSASLLSIGVAPDAGDHLLAAAATLGAGARAGEPTRGRSALRAGLELAGLSVLAVVVPGREHVARAVMGPDVPVRTIAGPADLATMRVGAGTAVFVDTGGDLGEAGLGVIATERDLVVEVSAVPDTTRARAGARLGLAAFWGAGFPRGVLSSPTTRRRGLVSLVDIAPTILDAVDPLQGGSFEGRPARAHAIPDVDDGLETSAARALSRLEANLITGRTSRAPITRSFLYASVLLVAFAVALRLRGARMLTTAALVVGAMPIAGFVSPLLPGGPRALTVVGVAIVIGLVAARTPRRGCIAIAGATVAIPLVDLALGSPIGYRSPWGLTLATGGRFYGASEDTLGFVLGGSLIACALLLERHRERLPLMVVGLAVATAILSAPSLGAKFGAIPTLVPVFGVFAVRALDRTVTLRVAAAIALATIVATGGSILADRLRPQEQRSHVARAIGGEVDVGDLIARKWRANADITFTRAWTPAALVAGVGLVVLARRRRLSDGLRRAGPAVAVGTVTAMAANDGGVVTAAILLALVAAASIATARRSPAPDVE